MVWIPLVSQWPKDLKHGVTSRTTVLHFKNNVTSRNEFIGVINKKIQLLSNVSFKGHLKALLEAPLKESFNHFLISSRGFFFHQINNFKK